MSLRFDAVLKEILGKDPADFQPAIHLPSTRPASRLNVDLSTISAATEGGLGLLPLATLCRMPADKPLVEAVRDVVRQIDHRLAQEIENAQAVRLMTAAFILAGMRIEKDELANIFDGVKIMHESTAYDMILDEGRIEGRIEEGIRVLLRLGRKKFGPPDTAMEAALSAIQDIDRLERMLDALDTAKSWGELLSTP